MLTSVLCTVQANSAMEKLAVKWGCMSEEEKAPYYQKAEEVKAAYFSRVRFSSNPVGNQNSLFVRRTVQCSFNSFTAEDVSLRHACNKYRTTCVPMSEAA